MKRLVVLSLVLIVALLLQGCGELFSNRPISFYLTPAATATAQPQTATVETISMPTPLPATATQEPTSVPATATPDDIATMAALGTSISATMEATATATTVAVLPAGCVVDSFSDHNLPNGETYKESPVGGLNEARWITWQGWTDGKTVYRYIFSVRPNTVVWIGGHTGGTGFYLCTDEAGATEDREKVDRELDERDGVNPNTIVAVLPDDAEKLPILLRYQVKDQEVVQVRHALFGPVLTVTATPTSTATP